MTYTRTAEVGLLTRLITIEGDESDAGHAKKHGARVYFSDYSQIVENELQEYIPVAQIAGVQFKNTGQKNFRDFFDPR